MKKSDNHGFSLVELIIVIAIMAILIGALAPVMIKYVEKANVSSDQQLLDSISKAVVYAVADPEVSSDARAQAIINGFSSPTPLEDIMTPSGNKLAEEVMDTLGWNDLNQSTYENMLRSAHQSNCTIYITYRGGVKDPYVFWITTTDNTGKKDTSNTTTDPDNLGNCIQIK